MKKVCIFSTVIAASFLLGSCSNSTSVSPSSTAKGSVSLKLDKTNVPQSVVTVQAILSRNGYDSMTVSTNVQTDSGATLQMSDIPVGEWHLAVNALDGGGSVLYSGETNAEIAAGTTTLVSLTLLPVSNSTGNISITVNWGIAAPNFTDYALNPILTSSNNPSNPRGVMEGKVIYDGGTYRMWYVGAFNSGYSIWYAQSSDGNNWTTETTQPVLTTNDTSYWDYGYYIAGGAVMKDGNLYRMYYNAINGSYGKSYTGLATSADGIVWSKYSSPVIASDSNLNYHIGTMSVMKVNGVYYLYYHSSPINNYNQFVINLATSNDGIHFTPYSGNPILTPTFAWEGVGITYPAVVYDGSQFDMVYENSDRTEYGIAYSSDGMHWSKAFQTPIFSATQTNKNWVEIDYPNLVAVNGGYRIYYTGVNSGQQMSICYVSSPNIR